MHGPNWRPFSGLLFGFRPGKGSLRDGNVLGSSTGWNPVVRLYTGIAHWNRRPIQISIISATVDIHEGGKAPAFTLKDQDNHEVSLEDFRGQDVVIYFYPRDDTPGCTKEACGFRDLWSEIEKSGTVVLGVSPDGAESHTRFIGKYQLPFTLLCDPDRTMMTRYGAYGEKMMYGKRVMGIIRSTVWIGADGNVKKHWRRVPKAADHPAKVLQAIQGA